MQGETLRLGYEMDTGMNSGLNPIWSARYLGYIFLLLLLIVREKPHNLLLYGYMLALFLYIVTAGSKGPVIALFGGCLVFFANEKTSVNIKTIFYIVLVIALLILMLNAIDFFSSQFFIDRFSSKTTSGEEREGLMDVAFHYFGAFSFLFGTGTGNFGYLIYHRDVREYPHNIVVELYIENGIFAIIILVLMYVSVLKNFRMIFKSTKLRMLFAMFIYFGMNSMFSGDLLGNEYFFIFFMLFHFEKLMILKTQQLDLQLEQFNSVSPAYLNK
ncbi:MAG: O-antigen ligase family protein [Bacteroidetes bacterium]|nr:O-antigen ligase family protein [Bacteroidota bacterium]